MELFFEGKISAKAILKNDKRKVYEVIMEQGKRNKDFGYIYHLATQKDIPVIYKTREEIEQLAHSHTHGGILVKADGLRQESIINKKLSGFVCFIDGVEDPYNLGSVCRTLYAAGCSALILPQRNWAQSENTILKASAGAFEHMHIFWIHSEKELLEAIDQNKIPLILAHRKEARSLFDYTFPSSFCLVVGGALRGISSQIVKRSSQNVFVEYARDCRYALDTASAVSAFSFEILRQRRKTV